MAIDRRKFLGGSGAILASSACPSIAAALSAGETPAMPRDLLASACRRADGQFSLLILTREGTIVRELPLNDRGHDIANNQRTGRTVAFARRPGRFALAFNARTLAPPHIFAPPQNRHFYGHGAFAENGQLLYVTENDFDNARGKIGIYDATDSYKRVAEFPSYGVGPHEALLLPDGRTIAIANGGIETHPVSGRTKLNIATMQPSLCFIDIESGDLKARHQLPKHLHHLSIRHLAADKDGNVWFGGQWQGDRQAVPQLIGHANLDTQLKLVTGSNPLGSALKGYIGSVALSTDGRWLAASAPRANQIIYIDTHNPDRHHAKTLLDGCGLAPVAKSSFAVSSGNGILAAQSPPHNEHPITTLPDIAFDNHMRAIS